MQPSEVSTSFHFLVPPSLSTYFPHFNMTQNDNNFTSQFNRVLNPIQNIPPPLVQEINLQTPCPFSSNNSNSTSDEADEQQLILINERKQRRMLSNRESARRSRMRKQKHLDELWSQVIVLRNENHLLLDQLNHVAQDHDRVMQENVQLKEEATELRQMLNDMQLTSASPYATLKDLEDQFPSSMDLLS